MDEDHTGRTNAKLSSYRGAGTSVIHMETLSKGLDTHHLPRNLYRDGDGEDDELVLQISSQWQAPHLCCQR